MDPSLDSSPKSASVVGFVVSVLLCLMFLCWLMGALLESRYHFIQHSREQYEQGREHKK
jgi:Na+-transporting methylmalonyl-CoA/oxaloacetate decarboxylase gamma subunit